MPAFQGKAAGLVASVVIDWVRLRSTIASSQGAECELLISGGCVFAIGMLLTER